MRRIVPIVIASLLSACRETPPPPTLAPAAPAPALAAPSSAPAAAAKVAPKADDSASWGDPSTIENYQAFSADGLAYAAVDFSSGAGLYVLTIHAVPTNTVEKRSVIDSPQTRQRLIGELLEDGFPAPAHLPRLPPTLHARVTDGKVTLLMNERPVAAPFNPLDGDKPARAAVLAITPDGKTVAVRVEAKNGAGEFGPLRATAFVKLFE